MKNNRNRWDSTKWAKMPYIDCVPSTKTQKY